MCTGACGVCVQCVHVVQYGVQVCVSSVVCGVCSTMYGYVCGVHMCGV